MKEILIQGKEYIIPHSNPREEPVCLICTQVDQRNWSRIGTGYLTTTKPGEPEVRVFLKQFLSSTGQWHERQWLYEKDGIEIAARVLDGVAHIPNILGIDQPSLLHVYEYRDLISLDDLLRKAPDAFDQYFPLVMKKMVQILDRLQQPNVVAEFAGLCAKQRPYGGNRKAINFKGFDIRNVGIQIAPQMNDLTLVLFDLGRPYLAPIEEAAAKLFVSVGLLNWGRPMRRFLLGPDKQLLQSSHLLLKGFLNSKAIQAERDSQKRFRNREMKAPDRITRVLKNAGIKTIGRSYFRNLDLWCTRNLQ